jgi:hypothetical protein
MEPSTYVKRTWRYLLPYVLLLIYFIILSSLSRAQCISSGVRSATVIVDDNSVGGITFDDPTFAMTSDAARARADALLSLLSGSSHYLRATNFGFSIPSYASICGITVEVQKRASGLLGLGEWIQDNSVRIIKGGVIQTAADYAKTGVNWTGTDTYHTYGGANDKWGLTAPGAWTPADINSSNFGVAISARFNALAIVLPSAQVNHLRITVSYDATLPTHLLSFSSSLKNNLAHLEWQTADEEEGESLALQRSVVGRSEWTDIANFAMHTGNSGKKYSYNDLLAEKGNYSYRIRITNNYGQHIYSAIKNIKYTGTAQLSVFPNPATDFIVIENTEQAAAIVIRNLYMQQVSLPVQATGNGAARVDIRQLPKGMYFASLDGQAIRFLKQ